MQASWVSPPVAMLASRIERVASIIGAEGQLPDDMCLGVLSRSIEVLDAFVAFRSSENTDECTGAIVQLGNWLATHAGPVRGEAVAVRVQQSVAFQLERRHANCTQRSGANTKTNRRTSP